MKVYAVIMRAWDDDNPDFEHSIICGIYATRELAIAYIEEQYKMHNSKSDTFNHRTWAIQEYDLHLDQAS